ncbi:MAG: YiiD C-terminal domain-containing protein [Burkholderiales bacterium]|nr:YiiD C-terminal domain-containing protein [Burkholderiales bacterium]
MQRDWQQMLQATIPLSAAMQVGIVYGADGRVELTAPLAPNVNDKGTGFGGSLATLATLAGWVEVRRQLDGIAPDVQADIVIQRGETSYLHPVTAAFSAQVDALDADELGRFAKLFIRRGVARMPVAVQVLCGGVKCAEFRGEYVASRLV